MSLADSNGVVYKINIFLIVLGYSRYKYIELTTDREQHTLFKCLTNAFNYFGGSTETILFDNMKTVVDRAKSEFNKVVLNTKMVQYAKDANFEIHTCRAYKPNTKGKVETLAKVMNRLKAFDTEFSDLDELNEIQKIAVICNRYDSEVNNGGHGLYFDSNEDIDNAELLEALKIVSNSKIAKNFEKAIQLSEEDDTEELDEVFFSFKPSLSDYIEKYVEKNKKEIFK